MSRAEGRDDLPLHVEATGRGPPVLLLHGYAASTFCFRAWIPGLAESHRVLAVDLKGFGSAPGPDDGRYSPLDLAEPVLELVRREDLRNLTLVGHSLGGGVALIVALRLLEDGDFERIQALVSVAGMAYPQRLPPFVRLARYPRLAGAALRLVSMRWLVRRVLERVVYDPSTVDGAQVEGYARPLTSPAARRVLLTSARQIVPAEVDALTARYGRLDVPALLLWGRQDPVVPLEVGRRLAATLPRASLRILAECGHLPAEERPTESLRILRDFLRDVHSGRGPGAPA